MDGGAQAYMDVFTACFGCIGLQCEISEAQTNQKLSKFRKFATFHRPVIGFSELGVRPYTKIVTREGEKMLS